MKVLTALACLVLLASPLAAQDDLYWMTSFDDAAEMQIAGFGVNGLPAPGEFFTGQIPGESGEVILLFEASTGWFLDAPPGADSGAAVAAAEVVGEAADMVGAASEEMEAEKHRSFGIATIWAMDADTETYVHWNLTGVEAHGHAGSDGYYVVRVTYESATP
ncbi:MAG: hypothetical protein ACE5FP_06615, partial [Gemmatimonadota bacterium]